MAILEPSSVSLQTDSACTGPCQRRFGTPALLSRGYSASESEPLPQKKDGKSTPEAEPGDFVAFQIMTVTDVWRRLIRSHKHDR